MSSDRLIYLPLGGAGEIGMNAYVYGYGEQGKERLILVDLGVTFSDMETTPGVDLIFPDMRWLIENKERNYKNLRSRRNLDNNCPDEVVDSLLNGVRSAGVPLCKRYYAMKKQILKQTQGLETFRWSDRNAPIEITKAEEGKISWEAAVQMVERGYRKFSPTMAGMFMDMVNEKRIDVPAADGKKGGAYCAGVVPGIGPFQLLNFDG